ncbi:hypothetical protein [Monoglobus pectinilyticus]|jgi:hypothetical protein|uniref:Uncharacterized protein n=1 Tax=Monoglobus pectinilyticus TaxID=1981510 RepID=A0A2K9P3Z1_9FIRM|nr:hypothetical protein [Monoglobus pectinilyticus]AUO19951.1 hypothetical protein B9O19_01797 [Monoglobus pectinilyticus]
MKKYTIEDIKKLEKNEYGIIECPKGDYSSIKFKKEILPQDAIYVFEDGCAFGDGNDFSGYKFKNYCFFCSDNNFGSGSIFGCHCTFGNNNTFNKNCTFGSNCSAGANCTIDNKPVDNEFFLQINKYLEDFDNFEWDFEEPCKSESIIFMVDQNIIEKELIPKIETELKYWDYIDKSYENSLDNFVKIILKKLSIPYKTLDKKYNPKIRLDQKIFIFQLCDFNSPDNVQSISSLEIFCESYAKYHSDKTIGDIVLKHLDSDVFGHRFINSNILHEFINNNILFINGKDTITENYFEENRKALQKIYDYSQ